MVVYVVLLLLTQLLLPPTRIALVPVLVLLHLPLRHLPLRPAVRMALLTTPSSTFASTLILILSSSEEESRLEVPLSVLPQLRLRPRGTDLPRLDLLLTVAINKDRLPDERTVMTTKETCLIATDLTILEHSSIFA